MHDCASSLLRRVARKKLRFASVFLSRARARAFLIFLLIHKCPRASRRILFGFCRAPNVPAIARGLSQPVAGLRA